jgi:hypothetical protein
MNLVPEVRERARAYGALLRTLLGQRHRERRADIPIRTRVVAPAGGVDASLERAVPLTPYTAQNIAEDALRVGRGARLEVTVPASIADAGLAAVHAQFAWLGRRDIHVRVRRAAAP